MAWAGSRRWAWGLVGLLGGLLVATGLWAVEPNVCPERGVQIFLGLDDTSAPTQVRDGRATSLQNVLLDVSRSLTKRHGVRLIGNSCDASGEAIPAINGLYYTKFSSGLERIIRICGGRLQYLSGSTWTTVSGLTFVRDATAQFVFATALDNIIGTNDQNIPFRYDGTTVAEVSFSGLTNGIRRAKTVAFFKNYLLVFNITEGGVDYPTRFRWANVGTIDTWTSTNYIDIGALGGQEINAVAELYDNLYVFLTDSIYKLSLVGGADTWQVTKITDDIGGIAKNGVQSITLSNAQAGLVFLDKEKKIYFFNGIYAQDISSLITTTLASTRADRLSYAVSADTTTDYWLCLSTTSATSNDLCLDLQYQIGEWTKHTNISANSMAQVVDSSGAARVYWGNDSGLTYQLSDSSLRSDVGSAEGRVTEVATYNAYATETGLQVLYASALDLTTGVLVGAPIEIVNGTGTGSSSIVLDNTVTGLIVSGFTVTPDTTSQFEVGGIDAFYTTKWYDMGYPTRLKQFGEVYFWAEADTTSTISVSYGTDLNTDGTAQSIALTSSASDTTWGSTTTGTGLWGTGTSVFRNVKLETQGRFLRVTWAEDDPDELFHLYGFNKVYWMGDVN